MHIYRSVINIYIIAATPMATPNNAANSTPYFAVCAGLPDCKPGSPGSPALPVAMTVFCPPTMAYEVSVEVLPFGSTVVLVMTWLTT